MYVESTPRRPVLRTTVTVGVVAAFAGTALAPGASAAPAPTSPSPTSVQSGIGPRTTGTMLPAADDEGGGIGRTKTGFDHKVGEPIDPETTFARAEDWLNPPVPYSMSDFTNGPQGKSYRTDCSGFVSMAWHLPNSETTVSLPESTVEKISWDSLGPGDAVNRALPGGNGHVMLVEKVEGNTVHVIEQTPPKVIRSEHDIGTLQSTRYFPVRYKKMEAVSDEDVRERIEERMEDLEERINERLAKEVDKQRSPGGGDGNTGAGAAPSSNGHSAGATANGTGANAVPAKDNGRNAQQVEKDALPDINPRIQPPKSKTLTNFDSVFSVNDESYQEVIEMPQTGIEVEVYAEQTGWVWDWDDGSEPERTEHSGTPYPGTPRVTHSYSEAGTFQPSVDVEWGNYRYRIVENDEEWTNIEGDTTTAVQFPDLEVVELQNMLSD